MLTATRVKVSDYYWPASCLFNTLRLNVGGCGCFVVCTGIDTGHLLYILSIKGPVQDAW